MSRGVGLLVALAVALGGCARLGLVTGDSSVAWGGRAGVLFHPERLPSEGAGYWVPPRWENRGLRYGTDELVSMVVYAGRELHHRLPGVVFGVADLSPVHGGSSRWHRSHQNGRDVDLIYMARDADDNPVMVDRMPRYRADGTAMAEPGAGSSSEPNLFFDDRANWILVRALLDNPVAEVQWIFISDDLKQRLLDYARSIGEPRGLILRAGYILHQPSDSLAHDDHMHVRIFCPPSDVARGCRDYGVFRWVARDYKYERRIARLGAGARLAARLLRPFRLMLSLGGLPLRGFVPRASAS